MTVIKLYPTSVALASDANTGSGGHHKSWDYLDNLKTENGTAYCGYNSNIDSKNGTYHTPAPLEFTFNLSNLTYDGEVAKLVVHYKQQANNTSLDIDGATCSLPIATSLNTRYGSKVTNTETSQEHMFVHFVEQQVLTNSFKIRLEFPQNLSTNTGRLTIKDFYLEVVSAQVLIKYPQNIRITSGYTCGAEDNQYKCWDNLDNLKTGGTAYCRHPNYSSPLIAGKNGTYKQPAPLDITDFGFNFGDDIVIEKGIFHFEQQKFINNGYYPEIGGAKITPLNLDKASSTGPDVTETLGIANGISKGLTTEKVNSNKFGFRFAYPANSSTTPGRIILQNVFYKIFYNDMGIRLTLDGRFTKSTLVRGETTNAVFTVKKVSSAEYNSITYIDLPVGVAVNGSLPSGVTKTNQTVNGQTIQRLKWVHYLSGSANVSNTITVSVVANTPNVNITDGNKCTITDQNTEISYNCFLNVKDVTVTLETDLYKDKKPLRTDHDNNFNLVYKSNDPLKLGKIVKLKFEGLTEPLNIEDYIYDELEDEGVEGVISIQYDDFGDGAYSIYIDEYFFDEQDVTITIPLYLNTNIGGEYSVQIWTVYDDNETLVGSSITKNFIVLSKEMGKLAFSRVRVISEWKEQMGDGLNYTLGTNVKLTLDTNEHLVTDMGDNYRVGIYNSGIEYINDENSFLEHVVWCKNIATSTEKEVTVQFDYNAENHLYLVYSHGYTGDPVSNHATLNFSEPLLVETTEFNNIKNMGHSLWKISYMLLESETVYATSTFFAGIPYLNPVVLYDFDDGGLLDTNISILGLELMFNYIVTDTVMMSCEIILENNVKGVREILLRSGEGVAHIGNAYDLFGLKVADFIDRENERIKPFELRFTVKNPYDTRSTVQINNCILALEYVTRTKCGYGFSIDGERGEDYGILLQKVSHNRGTKNVTSLYQVEGTDNTIVNRMNIDSKEITLSIKIHNCRMGDGKYQVDKVVELFTNNRELHSNKPVLKKLVLDHLDDRYYEFARVESFDDDYKGGSYYADITLLVPDGTTYDVQETLSGPNGYNPSTISCSPTITYISRNAGECIIHEKRLDQNMIIESNSISNGSVLTIYNDEHKVFVNDSIDITGDVDFASNWFKVRGEYEFESDTGDIVEVAYRIRRG